MLLPNSVPFEVLYYSSIGTFLVRDSKKIRFINIENGKVFQRGSCMVCDINMGVCPRFDFENILFFNCPGYNFNIYGAFEFLCNSIANLWRHE